MFNSKKPENEYTGALPIALKESNDDLAKLFKGARLLAVFDGLQYQKAFNERPDETCPLLIALFKGTEDEPLAHAGPWLADVSASDTLAASILKLEGTCPSVIWLSSADHVSQLAAALRRRLNTTLPDGREAILRWWDPRTASAMNLNLSANSRRALFGAALEWFIKRDGKYFYIKGAAHDAA